MSCTLDELRSAAGGDKFSGPALIPFSGLRSDAERVRDEINSLKEASDVNSGVYRNQIEGRCEDIRNLQAKRTKEQGQEHPSQEAIDSLNKDINKAVETITNAVSELNRALGLVRRLIDARQRENRIYENVESQLSSLGENPERTLGNAPSDEDRKKFDDYIKLLRSEIRDQLDRHRGQVALLEQNVRNIEEVLNIRIPPL